MTGVNKDVQGNVSSGARHGGFSVVEIVSAKSERDETVCDDG